MFVGRGAGIPGIEELSKSVMKLPSSAGTTEIFGNLKTKLRDPSWFTALGLLVSGKENQNYSESSLMNLYKDIKSAFRSGLRQLLP